MTNDVNDTYFKILCEWKAVSEQTLHGKENVSNKKLKPRIWGMLLPATVKLIGIRCTLSYRITEREAQDSNPWKKKITRWTPLQLTDTQATGQQRKNQTWTQWSLWAENLVKKRQLKIRERVSKGELQRGSSRDWQSSFMSSAEFWWMDAFEDITWCWGKNHQKGTGRQSLGLKWVGWFLFPGVKVGIGRVCRRVLFSAVGKN